MGIDNNNRTSCLGKVRLLSAAVESVLTYGSESWTPTKALTNRLNLAFKHRLLRFALDIGWWDHVTIEKLYAGLA